jgi:hypothetical protein
MTLNARMALLGAIITTATAFAALGASVGPIEGIATAKDGDDVIVQGIDMRLRTLLPPKRFGSQHQLGGTQAPTRKRQIVGGKHVNCQSASIIASLSIEQKSREESSDGLP